MYHMSKAYKDKLDREWFLMQNYQIGNIDSEAYDKKFLEIQADFRAAYKAETGIDLN